jgi:hypothetical protein
MSTTGQITVIILGLFLALYVLIQLRKRKLNEEYCLWWLVIIAGTIFLVLNRHILLFITHLIGALVPVSTLTLFGLVLIIGMLVYFSSKISILTNQLRSLVQYSSMLNKELLDLKEAHKGHGAAQSDTPGTKKHAPSV